MGAVWALAWVQRGSIAAGDWLVYELLATLLLATLVASGGTKRPTRYALVGLAGLVALAVWAALSALWSPLPTLARDEALLTLFYAVVFAVPVLTIRSSVDRTVAVWTVVLALGALAVSTAVWLRFGSSQLEAYGGHGRLWGPVTYGNAQAAVFLVAFWPAVAVAAKRTTHVVGRACAVGLAAAMLAGWLLTQSRGGFVALAVSALVFFAFCPARLRLLVPTILAAVPVAAAADRMLAPYTIYEDAPKIAAIRGAGAAALVAASAAGALAVIYALVDQRVDLRRRTRERVGRLAALAAALVVLAGGAAFVASVGNPAAWAGERWDAFKQEPEIVAGGSHFSNPGSNRYDFWRVALGEFRAQPLQGAGSRGFGPAYLRHGRSAETPARTHSLPFEVLGENGLVGFLLLAAALGAPLLAAARRLDRVPIAAAFAASVYWIAHASGDWIWTFPVAAIPFFVLLGVGASDRTDTPLVGRPALGAAAAATAIAVFVLVPTWLSTRFVARVRAEGLALTQSELEWARRLDPLSVEPLVTEAHLRGRYTLVGGLPRFLAPTEAIPPLEAAVEKEPGSVALQYQLGLAYLDAGRKPAARERLRAAQELFPRERAIAAALLRAQ